jgi:hypothetical protein
VARAGKQFRTPTSPSNLSKWIMSGILTSDELAFSEKMKNENPLHAGAQKNYRKKIHKMTHNIKQS